MFPDLISLSLFLKAIKYQSLSRAAKDSHISLSAASRRIALLEHHFRVALLLRTPAGVQVTAAGVTLARHAQQLLRHAALMDSEMSDYAKGAIGRIRLQANISAMSQALPDQLATFSSAYPDIKLEIREARSRDIIQAVTDGQADVGVVTSKTIVEGLQYAFYSHDHLCAIVPSKHPIRAKQVGFADLLDYDIVGLDDSAAISRTLIQAAAQEDRPLRLRLQVQSFEAVCRLVAAGLGIGILPTGAVQPFLRVMNLRFIELSDSWATREMYLCMKTEQRKGPSMKLFEHLSPRDQPSRNSADQ